MMAVVEQAERRDNSRWNSSVVEAVIVDRADGRGQTALPDRLHQPAIVLTESIQAISEDSQSFAHGRNPLVQDPISTKHIVPADAQGQVGCIGGHGFELAMNVVDDAAIYREQSRLPALGQPVPNLVDDRQSSAVEVAGIVEDRIAQKDQVLTHAIH